MSLFVQTTLSLLAFFYFPGMLLNYRLWWTFHMKQWFLNEYRPGMTEHSILCETEIWLASYKLPWILWVVWPVITVCYLILLYWLPVIDKVVYWGSRYRLKFVTKLASRANEESLQSCVEKNSAKAAIEEYDRQIKSIENAKQEIVKTNATR